MTEKKTGPTDFFSTDNLYLAWERYVRGSQRESKDYFGMLLWQDNLDDNIGRLSERLLAGTFKPSRPGKIYMPKPSLMQRTMTCLKIEDGIAYQAIADTIATLHYDSLISYDESVFGSVLNEEVSLGTGLLKTGQDEINPTFFFFRYYLPLYQKFVNSVNNAVNKEGNTHMLATDITGFFDSIPHFNLLNLLSGRYGMPESILNMMSDWLNIWSGTRDSYTFGVGIPQGTQPSFFFANLLLHKLDELVVTKGVRYFRYMDDIRIYSKQPDMLREILVEMDDFLRGFGLSLSSAKTSIEPLTPETKKKAVINFQSYEPIFDYDQIMEQRDERMFEEHMKRFEDPDYIEDQIIKQMMKGIPEEFDIKFNDEESTETEDPPRQKKDIPGVSSVDDFGFETGQQTENSGEINIAKTPAELKKIARVQLEQVREDLDTNIDKDKDREIARRDNERIYMDAAYRFRLGFSILNQIQANPKPPVPAKTWLTLIDWFPWRCTQFTWCLNYYQPSIRLKKQLRGLASKYRSHEWIVSNIIETLALSQKFNTDELQEMLRTAQAEKSVVVRLAYYKLLISHSPDNQFSQFLGITLKREPVPDIKKELLYYQIKYNKGQLDTATLFSRVGL